MSALETVDHATGEITPARIIEAPVEVNAAAPTSAATDTDALKDAAVLQVAWAFRGAAVAAALGACASLALGVRRRAGEERSAVLGL